VQAAEAWSVLDEGDAVKKALAAVGLVVVALIAGCGGGNTANNGTGDALQQTAQQTTQPDAQPTALAALSTAAVVTGADGIVIDNYALVASTRTDRTVYEYTYNAEVTNWGSGDAAVTATLASTSPQIVVVEGALDVGEVAEGATVVSTDTFTIRVDRSQPFDDSALVWTAQATPPAPTTFELIDQALAAGSIDDETALLYKVYYEFKDSRLPAQYVGRDDGVREATAFPTAVARYATLSPATQNLLLPFIQSPDVPGSWYQQWLGDTQPASAVSQSIAGVVLATVAPGAEVVNVDSNGNPVLMRVRITKGSTTIFVYWDDARYPEDATTAFDVADAIDQTIWPKLTALFGAPPLGSKGVLDVRLVNVNAMTALYGDNGDGTLGLTVNGCHSGVPIVYLNRDQKKDIVQTAAHEVTHAILARFPRDCAETAWMGEATATWAEHYTYPNANTEQDYAPKFLKDPQMSLEDDTGLREYGAYLWFLYITKGETTQGLSSVARVRTTWDELATHDSLGAIDAAVGDLGGLKEQWPKFALYNWNRKETGRSLPPLPTRISGEPYVYYGQWDGLVHKARESSTSDPVAGEQLPKKVKLDGKIGVSYDLPHRIHHLGAKYWHFDFSDDNNIRRVRLSHPYANGSDPSVKVQVLYKVRNKGWIEDDWTTHDTKTLCRDRPEEDFEELVVVISNSEFNDRGHVLDDGAAYTTTQTKVEASALGCSNWKGSVSFDATSSGSSSTTLNETGEATNVTLEIYEDHFLSQSFKVTGGIVNWHHVGSYSRGTDTCSGDSNGSYILAGSLVGLEWFGAFASAGIDRIPRYALAGVRYVGVTPPDSYQCTSDPLTADPIYGSFDVWLDMSSRVITGDSPTIYDSDPTGNTLQGLSIIVEPDAVDPEFNTFTKTRTYAWSFSKNGTFDGEPLP